MSDSWPGSSEPPDPIGEMPPPVYMPVSPATIPPDLTLPPEGAEWTLGGDGAAPKSRRSLRKPVVAIAVAVSVVAAFAVVTTVNAREGGVHAALASVFSSPTLKVVISAHTTNPQEQAQVSKYAVALTLTSENGHQPLSGSDGVDDYEVSVLRAGVDIGDVIIVDHAVYVRVNFSAIDPSTYANELQWVTENVPPGSANSFAVAFLQDQWVGVEESTLESYAKGLGVTTAELHTKVNFDNLRNAFTLSFAQSWDTWASIHQLSSSNGVTVYSLKLPVQHFVSSFVKDITGSILNDLPKTDVATARMELSAASAAIHHIPGGLEIPMTLSVTNGSLTQLDVAYKGNSVDLAISHPNVGVSAPAGALMLTTSIIQSLLDDAGLCVPTTGSGSSSSGLAFSSPNCAPTGGVPGGGIGVAPLLPSGVTPGIASSGVQ